MIYETIGKNIKLYRKEFKMTQSELADLLFISPQMVSRYENNIAAPDIATSNAKFVIVKAPFNRIIIPTSSAIAV